MEALGINTGFLVLQIINFFIVFIVLYAWVYQPVTGLLEKRRTLIAQGLEDARIAAEARANAEKKAQKIMAEAQTKASEVVREATQRAEDASKGVKSNIEAETAKLRETARAEAMAERDRILGDARSQIAALAMAATHKLVGQAMDETRQRALIDEFFSGVKSGKVVMMESGAKMTGESAVVTSALPLTDKEQETVKKDVLAKLGGKGDVSFKVDPSILGGLVIRVGDKILDGSVSGQLESMRQQVR